MTRVRLASTLLVAGLTASSVVSPVYAVVGNQSPHPEPTALRAHRRIDRLTDRIRHARVRLERAEAHHDNKKAQRIKERLDRLRARRNHIMQSSRG